MAKSKHHMSTKKPAVKAPVKAAAKAPAKAAAKAPAKVVAKVAAKAPAKAPAKAQAKDLKPKKNAKGGIGLLVPAVQKVREAAARR